MVSLALWVPRSRRSNSAALAPALGLFATGSFLLGVKIPRGRLATARAATLVEGARALLARDAKIDETPIAIDAKDFYLDLFSQLILASGGAHEPSLGAVESPRPATREVLTFDDAAGRDSSGFDHQPHGSHVGDQAFENDRLALFGAVFQILQQLDLFGFVLCIG